MTNEAEFAVTTYHSARSSGVVMMWLLAFALAIAPLWAAHEGSIFLTGRSQMSMPALPSIHLPWTHQNLTQPNAFQGS